MLEHCQYDLNTKGLEEYLYVLSEVIIQGSLISNVITPTWFATSRDPLKEAYLFQLKKLPRYINSLLIATSSKL